MPQILLRCREHTIPLNPVGSSVLTRAAADCHPLGRRKIPGALQHEHARGKDFPAGRATSITSRALALALMVGVVYMSLASGVTSAAETTETATAVEKSTTDSAPPPAPRSQSTKHQLTLDGKVLNYTATVGWLILKGKKPMSTTRTARKARTATTAKKSRSRDSAIRLIPWTASRIPHIAR